MLASFSASALGLGQIEVKSRLGQPLLAEIPIVSSDPTELEQLRAGLASPATFARIGLRPPLGLVAELRFTQALDARGNPVIRVTSEQPVNDQLLTFLLEVDWGQGRLVREYSALIDAPRTVSAPLQPDIQAPVMDAPALVERPVTVEPAPSEPTPAPENIAGQPAEGEAAPASTDRQAAEAAAPIAAPPAPAEPAPVAPAPAAPAPAPAQGIAGDHRVEQGETLSGIASRVGGGNLDQTMIALLRANPDAFIGGNIHRLKAGAVLRVPGQDAVAALDIQQARAIVQAQTREWRAARRAVPQPAGAVAGDAVNRAGTDAEARAQAARVADARLEIVPPGASEATKAGTQSGISAGGEGAMLQQELTQTRETLAAREAEAQELKGRVAELEKLQKQQQQLIAMKDSELAAAQARLAQTQDPQAPVSALPWILAVIGALALGLSSAWFLRRRDEARPRFRAPSSTPSSLADAFPNRAEEAATPLAQAAPAGVAEAPAPAAPERPARATPAWHAKSAGKPQAQPDLLGAEAFPDQTFHEQAFHEHASHERLELARAYLDLGDLASARQLLGEIVVNGDLAARQQATRMLRELE